MYSMYLIGIENTLSIKQIFSLFPYSYFEKNKGIKKKKKWIPIPIKFFLKFLFR